MPTRSPSAAVVTGGIVDLGAGTDTLTFGNFTNSATVSNVETITGGAGADTITLAAAISGRHHRPRRRHRRADPAATSPTPLTVSNIETITGGTGADTVTLATALAGHQRQPRTPAPTR